MDDPLVTTTTARSLRVSPSTDPARPTHLSLVAGTPLDADELDATVASLRQRGHRWIRTSALHDTEVASFQRLGFEPCGRLVLLSCPLTGEAPGLVRPAAATRLRRGRTRDRSELLEIDRRSFPEPWRFDDALFNDAIEATPTTRFRVSLDGGRLAGYAICGVAGATAYLQRLAVDADSRRRGMGRSLVDDARWWSGRRGARSMVVNTAEDNEAALGFYRQLGFRSRPGRLTVLEHRATAGDGDG